MAQLDLWACKGSLPRALLLVAVHSGLMSMLPVLGAIQQGLGFKEGACYGLAIIEPFTVCLDNKARGAEMSSKIAIILYIVSLQIHCRSCIPLVFLYNVYMQNNAEEKEFNKAMCLTCLLDWPMAQCLLCKFHNPEKEVEFDNKTMEMNSVNGWTPTTLQETRISNLFSQIPQEYQSRATRECYGTDDHDFERKLTAYVLAKIWETYESPIAEASRIDAELGQHTIISGGEVLELSSAQTADNDIPF